MNPCHPAKSLSTCLCLSQASGPRLRGLGLRGPGVPSATNLSPLAPPATGLVHKARVDDGTRHLPDTICGQIVPNLQRGISHLLPARVFIAIFVRVKRGRSTVSLPPSRWIWMIVASPPPPLAITISQKRGDSAQPQPPAGWGCDSHSISPLGCAGGQTAATGLSGGKACGLDRAELAILDGKWPRVADSNLLTRFIVYWKLMSLSPGGRILGC